METKHNDELVMIISEKILPEKINKIKWHRGMDVIAIICGNYYEIQRIGFKHEVIIKKEEKLLLEDIIFTEDNNIVFVVLKDSTVYFLNITNGNNFNINFYFLRRNINKI
jgi:hypothetical protein